MKQFIAVLSFIALLAAVSGLAFAQNAVSARTPEVKKSSAPVAQTNPEQTISNLITAYAGGLNTQAKYLLYAGKADEEGYKKAAQLFRAMAKSEAVQAAVYARALAGLGSKKPEPEIDVVELKTTTENIRAALKAEVKEYETVYPEFLTQAMKDDVKLGMVAFGGAIKNKTKHKFLYQIILRNPDAWQTPLPAGYYVCKRCGNTVEALDFERCPNCRVPITWYLQVE
jgi:rubrerythrin